MELKDRVAAFEPELVALLKKYEIKLNPKLVFPHLNPQNLPVDVALALQVINNNKGIVQVEFQDEREVI